MRLHTTTLFWIVKVTLSILTQLIGVALVINSRTVSVKQLATVHWVTINLTCQALMRFIFTIHQIIAYSAKKTVH